MSWQSDWGIGYRTRSELSLWVRASSNGDVVLTDSDGSELARETAATATNDGVVSFILDVSGGEKTITGSEPSGGTFSADIGPASNASKIAVLGCTDNYGPPRVSVPWMRAQGVKQSIWIGDNGYFEGEITFDGDTWSGGSNATYEQHADPSGLAVAHRAYRNASKRHMQQVGVVHQPDDHDYAGINNFVMNETIWNNRSWSPREVGDTWAVEGVADMRAIHASCYEAFSYYTQSHPVNTDPEAEAGAMYYRFRFNDLIEVFCLSCIAWGSGQDAARGSTHSDSYGIGNMISDAQYAWLLAALSRSSAPFKLGVCPKQFLRSEKCNQDAWRARWDADDTVAERYDIQAKDLLSDIHSQSANWNVPGGLGWIGGDFHSDGVYQSRNGVDSATADHCQIITNDGKGVQLRNCGSPSPYAKVWFNTSNSDAADSPYANSILRPGCGMAWADDEFMHMQLYQMYRPIFTGKVAAGTNYFADGARTLS